MILTSEITKTVVDTDKIEKLIRDLLDERFGDEFVFDPIEITARVFDDGETADDFLQIYIVFEGDCERLPASWTARAGNPHSSGVDGDGVGVPCREVVHKKSEWEGKLRYRKRMRGTYSVR